MVLLFLSCVSLPCWNKRNVIHLTCLILAPVDKLWNWNVPLWNETSTFGVRRTVITVVMSSLIKVAVVSLQIRDQDQDTEKVSVWTFHSQEAQIWLDVFSWRWSADSCFGLKAVRFSHKHATSCLLWKKKGQTVWIFWRGWFKSTEAQKVRSGQYLTEMIRATFSNFKVRDLEKQFRTSGCEFVKSCLQRFFIWIL